MSKTETQTFRIGKYHSVELTYEEYGRYFHLIAFDPNSPRSYRCTLCNKTFRTSNGASIHLSKYHDTFIVETLLEK